MYFHQIGLMVMEVRQFKGINIMAIKLKEDEQLCPFCDGLKQYPPSLESSVPCPYCAGTGKLKKIKKDETNSTNSR